VNIRKTAEFLTDVELQYEWYAQRAGWDVADRYLGAIESTCTLLASQPRLGPLAGLTHPRLSQWRFFMVFRPFHRHLLFYEMGTDAAEMRRAMDGSRDLPHRLLEPQGAE